MRYILFCDCYRSSSNLSGSDNLLTDKLTEEQAKKVWQIYNLIYEGAHSFLYAEYKFIGYFIVVK